MEEIMKKAILIFWSIILVSCSHNEPRKPNSVLGLGTPKKGTFEYSLDRGTGVITLFGEAAKALYRSLPGDEIAMNSEVGKETKHFQCINYRAHNEVACVVLQNSGEIIEVENFN